MDHDVRPEGSSTPEAYEYTPFTDNHSIRILTLEPGTGGEPLVGHLTIESLDCEPQYEAISYVWGTEGRCSEIACDGRFLPLTRSIQGALQRVRHATSSRRLWADQICINQDDIAERSRQVGLMNAIYKGAQHVLVWLGPDQDDVAGEATAMIHYLHAVFTNDEMHDEFRLAHSERLLHQDQKPWLPFSKMTKLQWFNRIWIVQEIGTTAPATLYWGNAEIDWELLSLVAGVLSERYYLLRSRFVLLTPNIRYLHKRFVEPEEDYSIDHHRGPFIYALHRARHLLAKDPRDHVYAFLGHFSIHTGSKSLAELVPDYSRSIEDIYYDVAARELSGCESLLLLSTSYGVPATYTRRPVTKGDLPTWVPDWRLVPLHIIGVPQAPHRASGDLHPQLHIDDRGRTLHIRGVRIDRLRQPTWTFWGNAFQLRRTPGRQLAIELIWRVCGRNRFFSLQQRYPNGDSAFFALVQTLTNACVGYDRTRPYEDIPKTEWLANGAAYVVRALGKHRTIAPELHELAQSGDAFKWSHEATLVTRYRAFAVTAGGYFVLGPDVMELGDVVAVLYGGRTPFLLRKMENSRWMLVGECYVHGLMNGEALEWDGLRDEEFVII
ncbi:hypothetical protein FZEAL_5815 [Fusarium zealandicum]|uniref:Heterokaryon incompatibility domain-containing protein n=1 Tax=Fusarium zealandicum TaxID=1053134 RepID=A0A8H4XKI2_9HYPO|nr:hypothetical protein FZEAL_5815 [Fusarium zealandicum]